MNINNAYVYIKIKGIPMDYKRRWHISLYTIYKRQKTKQQRSQMEKRIDLDKSQDDPNQLRQFNIHDWVETLQAT